MARPREFDLDVALDAAMHVFWRKGYEGTSLGDLLDAMQIARGSLYKAFEDKHDVYLASLDRYDRSMVEGAVQLLRNATAGGGLSRISRLLNAAVDPVAQQGDRRGCFICNAAVDRAPHDPEVETRVRAMLGRIEQGIETALAQTEAAGSWSDDRLRSTAHALTSAYMGVRVMAKAGVEAPALRSINRATLASLELAEA